MDKSYSFPLRWHKPGLLIGLPLAVLVITQKDPYWPIFYAGLVLFGIGILLIKKYDKDKKKSQV